MAFDFKKEYKEFYMPKSKPEIVIVPTANYIAVRGQGNPNEDGGDYQKAITVLYAVAYTLKMSYKTEHKIEGFYEYVVPPLEGFWWQNSCHSIDYSNKDTFNWISVIRLPDFVTKKDFDWAVDTAIRLYGPGAVRRDSGFAGRPRPAPGHAPGAAGPGGGGFGRADLPHHITAGGAELTHPGRTFCIGWAKPILRRKEQANGIDCCGGGPASGGENRRLRSQEQRAAPVGGGHFVPKRLPVT